MSAAGGLKILCQIDPSAMEPLIFANLESDLRGKDKVPALIEFQDGTKWVDHDMAFDAVIANEIVKSRSQAPFIVTDANYTRVGGPFRALDKAIAARSSAKVQIVSMVENTEDDEDEPLGDPTLPDPAAASAGGGELAAV